MEISDYTSLLNPNTFHAELQVGVKQPRRGREDNRPSSSLLLLKEKEKKPASEIDVGEKAVVLLLCDVFLLAACPRASIKLHRKGQTMLMVFEISTVLVLGTSAMSDECGFGKHAPHHTHTVAAVLWIEWR